ncbi:hypothetical protein G7062_01400 [Erysipelothrix sp. HDW6C]|uniref:hypothetical protein n=1 Tax=Erysipelothrix sp. HDW6C TaxID=2714930 RepID=UPI0014086607|nr:hypothetical protein [Erysipelothrix sp. HDW6C]QIK69018.1 hypothetical protein G7062_01400 [Erysipelothrix sp. HDW6C]
MKKLLAVLLVSLLVLTGCGSKGEDKPSGETPATGKDYKIGTGIKVSAKSKEAADGKDGSFETNVYFATVVLDGDKIAQVQIDVAQNQQAVKADGTIVKFEFKGTKKTQGKDYGMAGNSGIKKEWFEQIEALEAWAVGKTPAEVAGLATEKKDDAHPAVPTDADLTSSVTISVQDYLDVIALAVTNATDVKNVASVGMSASTTGAEDKLDLNTTVAVSAFDPEGKIVYSFIDDAKVTATIDGTTITPATDLRTKTELKEEYGMKEASKLGKEWYEQVAELRAWAIGKTAEEVGQASDADITSMVSFYAGGLKSAVEATKASAKTIGQ